MSKSSFDLEHLHTAFQTSLTDDNDVKLEPYNNGYDELILLLNQMGKMFYFVVQDVQAKLDILNKLRADYAKNPPPSDSEPANPYDQVNTMLSYEKKKGYLEPKAKLPSGLENGSRTLLRLHRALLFLIELMEKVADDKCSSSMAQLTHEAYSNTLAPYHDWLVRKAVGVATYALPDKHKFVAGFVDQQSNPDLRSVDGCRGKMLNDVVPAMKLVYHRIQKTYEDEVLLTLP